MSRIQSLLCCGIVALSSGGCQKPLGETLFSESFWNPFGLKLPFQADQDPVRIGVVTEGGSMLNVRSWWDITERTPWTDFRQALSSQLHRPVQIEELELFQVSAHLESGRLQFALLNDENYKQMQQEGDFAELLAMAKKLDRTGLIVASAKSNVQSISDIAGKRFAFGPRGDSVLHFAAAAALMKGGVSMLDLQRELIPLNALQYHISSRESAKEIVYGTTEAGVIDKAEYDAYPESGGQFFPLSFSKDQFRVLAETEPVDLGPFVASKKTAPELVKEVRGFLTSSSTLRANVTASMGIAGFSGTESISGDTRSASARRLAGRR